MWDTTAQSVYSGYALMVVHELVPYNERQRNPAIGEMADVLRGALHTKLLEDLMLARRLYTIEAHDQARTRGRAGFLPDGVPDEDRLMAASLVDRLRDEPATCAAMRKHLHHLQRSERGPVLWLLDECAPLPKPSQIQQWKDAGVAALVVGLMMLLLFVVLRFF